MNTRVEKRKKDKVTSQSSGGEARDTRHQPQLPSPPQTPPPPANINGLEGQLDGVEREEFSTPVRNIAGRGVQWTAHQIAEWFRDSDEIVVSD